MASKFPLRLTAGYAVMLTDAYQVPVIAVKSVYDNVTGFFGEAMRSRKTMPFNVSIDGLIGVLVFLFSNPATDEEVIVNAVCTSILMSTAMKGTASYANDLFRFAIYCTSTCTARQSQL